MACRAKGGKACCFAVNWADSPGRGLVNLRAVVSHEHRAMTPQALVDVVQQMNSLAEQAQGVGATGASPAMGGFAGELEASLQRINRLQQTATHQANAFQAGSSEVSLVDVMADSQKASVAFQMGVQVRNRLLTAYKDVMALQV